MKQIPFPSGTPLQANSTVSEKVIQSIPITTVSSGAKEQITGGRAEEKMKEKIEMKGIVKLQGYLALDWFIRCQHFRY